jgi:hypothetical protein
LKPHNCWNFFTVSKRQDRQTRKRHKTQENMRNNIGPRDHPGHIKIITKCMPERNPDIKLTKLRRQQNSEYFSPQYNYSVSTKTSSEHPKQK